jgi:hypothetical protein
MSSLHQTYEDFNALRLSENPTGQIQLNGNLSGTTWVML